LAYTYSFTFKMMVNSQWRLPHWRILRKNIQPENAVSFWETSSPDYLPGLLPWTPLGDFRSQDLLFCGVWKILKLYCG